MEEEIERAWREGIAGDWFTIEGARAAGWEPEIIANLDRSARLPASGRRCQYPEPCIWRGDGPAPTCETTEGCRRAWDAGTSWTGPLGWLRLREHVARVHHPWLHEKG